MSTHHSCRNCEGIQPESCPFNTPSTALDQAIARAELVRAALIAADSDWPVADVCRREGGDPTPTEGNWCAYGMSLLLERCGFRAPPPGTRARRGARALVRWIGEEGGRWVYSPSEWTPANLDYVSRDGTLLLYLHPGDVIAWWADPERKDWRGHVAMYVGQGANDPSKHGLVGANELLRDGSFGWRYAEVATRALVFRRPGGIYGIARPVLAGVAT